MKNVKLNNGVEMPILGLGVLRTSADETRDMVSTALLNGYRLIDTAAGYMNEKDVAEGIKLSGIKREEIFLTSKLWVSDMGYEKTLAAFDRTLNLLDTDYLDLWLIHEPYGDIFGTWKAMTELYNQGKIRAIGVSNFHNDRIMDLICNSGGPVPVVNQLETHLYNQNHEVQNFLIEQNVQLEAWAPLASGMRDVFNEEIVQKLAQKYNKKPGQIILRWLTQRGIVTITKTTHKERMIENIESLNFELDDKDMLLLRSLDENKLVYTSHRDPDYVKLLSEQKLKF